MFISISDSYLKFLLLLLVSSNYRLLVLSRYFNRFFYLGLSLLTSIPAFVFGVPFFISFLLFFIQSKSCLLLALGFPWKTCCALCVFLRGLLSSMSSISVLQAPGCSLLQTLSISMNRARLVSLTRLVIKYWSGQCRWTQSCHATIHRR